MTHNSTQILGFSFPITDKQQMYDHLDRILTSTTPPGEVIFTPNAEILFQASKNEHYFNTLSAASLLIPDGIGVSIAAKMLGSPFDERMTGIEFAEHILTQAAKKKRPIFLLGGKPGVAETAKKQLEERFSSICICGTHHGYFDKNATSAENRIILEKIKNSNAEILFVCMGAPLQEYWIVENSCKLPSLFLSIGLGGCLDVWSKSVSRAPITLQKLGLEWLYRVIKQPSRIKRLPRIIGFLFAVKHQKKVRKKEKHS